MARTPAVTRGSVQERNERPSMLSWLHGGRCQLPDPDPLCSRPRGRPARPRTGRLSPHRYVAFGPNPGTGDAARGSRERLPIHLERPRSTGSPRGPARRNRRRPSGQAGTAQPGRGRTGVVNFGREFFRTRRVSQGSFDAVVAHFGVNGATEPGNPDGLLRHAGLQRQRLRRRAAAGPHRRGASNLESSDNNGKNPTRRYGRGPMVLGKSLAKLLSGYPGGYRHMRRGTQPVDGPRL